MTAHFVYELVRRIEQLETVINQLDRRQNNSLREGRITEVFPDEGMAKVDAGGVISKKVPWLQRAGAIREWSPPTIGERVILISPSGEPGQGMILPGGYTDEFAAPHDKGGEKVVTIGDVTITQTDSAFVIAAGGVTVTISASGLKVSGGKVEHDGKNIGSTHTHGGIVRGSNDTDGPNA